MQASIAISGLFPPCIADGEVLVDGALVNSLPTDVMETMCQGTIIAVDAARYQPLRPSRNRGSGFWRRLFVPREFDGLSICSGAARWLAAKASKAEPPNTGCAV